MKLSISVLLVATSAAVCMIIKDRDTDGSASPTPALLPSSPALSVSTDAQCGSQNAQTCLGSVFGPCCSQFGWCGSSSNYCNADLDCQPDYGTCSSSASSSGLTVSKNGRCGHGYGASSGGMTCAGSAYGNCCSQYSHCGSKEAYCGPGCQTSFGDCSTNLTLPSTLQTSAVVSSTIIIPTFTPIESPQSTPSADLRCGVKSGEPLGRSTFVGWRDLDLQTCRDRCGMREWCKSFPLESGGYRYCFVYASTLSEIATSGTDWTLYDGDCSTNLTLPPALQTSDIVPTKTIVPTPTLTSSPSSIPSSSLTCGIQSGLQPVWLIARKVNATFQFCKDGCAMLNGKSFALESGGLHNCFVYMAPSSEIAVNGTGYTVYDAACEAA